MSKVLFESSDSRSTPYVWPQLSPIVNREANAPSSD
jgi:hypothetical protein